MSEGISWMEMAMTMAGGLALFLFGMEQMGNALKVVAGNRMRDVLGMLTTNRFMGLLTGASITAIIQSSSVTTVMLVGFVSAGLMSLSQAIGVILGADIGTTITAQIVAFKVTKYALVPVSVGFVLVFMGKGQQTKQYGHLIMGLGLIFFGMGLMSAGMKPLRSHEPFLDIMRSVETPIVGIVVATAFTGLVQSSSATMGVVIAFASQGLISLEAGIALALGANVGTCVTAGLAALGKPREAVRVAVAHVTFKVVGVLLLVGFIDDFAVAIRSMSPSADSDLTGADVLAAEVPRQIANAHTFFNVGIALLFLPAAPLFARFCEWVVPDRPTVASPLGQPEYLDPELVRTPSLALSRARLELGRLGRRLMRMNEHIMPALLGGDSESLDAVAEMDEVIDRLYGHIVTYLRRVGQMPLGNDQTRELTNLLAAANSLESLGDLVETDLVGLGRQRLSEGLSISEPTKVVILAVHEAVAHAVAQSVRAIELDDADTAQLVVDLKPDINRLLDSAAAHQTLRLTADEPDRLAAYTLETEVLEKLRRMYYFAKRAAKSVPSSG